MQSQHRYSNLIYEYLLMKIRFEYLKNGDTFPTIDTLCEKFAVANQTVKAALQRLRQEGYISTRSGKPTKVTFQQSEQERKEYAVRFFAQRKDAFTDLKESVQFVSVPMLIEGFRRMDDDDLGFLARLAERATPIDLLRSYFYVFQKLDNQLVMNFFWEASMFQGFSLLYTKGIADFYDRPFVRSQLREIVALGRRREWDALQGMLLQFQKETLGTAIHYIGQRIEPLPKEEQIPFVWRIYRDRPQICYSLTVHMLFDIYMGEYRHVQYLPSYEKMARRYNVSVSTMRRTVSLLNRLGTVRTINGKGTRVYTVGENSAEPDWSCPPIRRNLTLFFQAFEMMKFSCEDATRTLLSSLTQQEKEDLIGQLNVYLRSGCCDLTLWCLMISIARRSPLQTIREIYEKLFELSLWGYPLKASSGKIPDFDQATRRLTESIIQCIEADDFDRCAAIVKQFVVQELPGVEKYLYNLGITPEELRMSQCIRFLLPESLD